MKAPFTQIEVYEAKAGQPRTAKECLEILEVPPNGMLPAIGDRISVNRLTAHDIQYRVVDRVFCWGFFQEHEKDHQKPGDFRKMWIFVEAITN